MITVLLDEKLKLKVKCLARLGSVSPLQVQESAGAAPAPPLGGEASTAAAAGGVDCAGHDGLRTSAPPPAAAAATAGAAGVQPGAVLPTGGVGAPAAETLPGDEGE